MTVLIRNAEPTDLNELVALDERHNTLSGPATKKLCERALTIFKQTQYQRLAGISCNVVRGNLAEVASLYENIARQLSF